MGRNRGRRPGGQAFGLGLAPFDLAGKHGLGFGFDLHLLDRSSCGFQGGFAQGPGLLRGQSAGGGQGGRARPAGAPRARARGSGLGVGARQLDGPGRRHQLNRDHPLDEFGWGEQGREPEAEKKGQVQAGGKQSRVAPGPGVAGFGQAELGQGQLGQGFRVGARSGPARRQGQGRPPGAGTSRCYDEEPGHFVTLRRARAAGGAPEHGSAQISDGGRCLPPSPGNASPGWLG